MSNIDQRDKLVFYTEKGYEISGEKEYDINDYALPDYGLVEKV